MTVRVIGVLFFVCVGLSVQAQPSRNDVASLFQAGAYAEALKAVYGAADSSSSPAMDVYYEIQCLLMLGRYDDAEAAARRRMEMPEINDGMILWACLQVFDLYAMAADSNTVLRRAREWSANAAQLKQAASQAALAELMLRSGWDARQVLEQVLVPARRIDPQNRWPHLVGGNMALRAGDNALAARNFRAGLRGNSGDPDLLYGLAVALSASEPRAASELLDEVLEVNPQHTDALIFKAKGFLTRGDFSEAVTLAERVLGVNPRHADALAVLGVVHNLRGNFEARDRLEREVEVSLPPGSSFNYSTGVLLARRYLFAEAVPYLRDASQSLWNQTRARFELGQALLRAGFENQGWRVIQAVRRSDPYHIGAYNLIDLQNRMSDFVTRRRGVFVLRMDRREMSIYGERAMLLLERTQAELEEIFHLELPEQVVIEIFPEQSDFEVRTFGVPLGESFLGVCFGNLITMVSPDSGLGDVNWEAVLVHELIHTATLTATENRMPRWLSEGFSVLGERVLDKAWGRRFRAAHAHRIQENGLPALRELNMIFGIDVDFAYTYSAYVVEFALEGLGLTGSTQWLERIRAGENAIDVWIELGEFGDEAMLSEAIRDYIEAQLERMAPGLDLSFLDLDGISDDADSWDAETILERYPENYWAIMEAAQARLDGRDWDGAIELLNRIVEAYPLNTESSNAWFLLARAHRELGQIEGERTALQNLVRYVGSNGAAYRRLIAIGQEREDWELVRLMSDRLIAVSPTSIQVYLDLAEAQEKRFNPAGAVAAYSLALQLEPDDIPELYFRQARLIQHIDPDMARGFLLAALERVPLYREALYLLLEINGE